MEYYHTIHAHLYGESFVIKAIRADETVNLLKMVTNKQRLVVPPNLPVRQVTPEDIAGIVNIKTCRLLKMAGKIWDQLDSEESIWFISQKEWSDYSEKVLIHECKVRHGKKLMIRNPAAMSPKQLFDMVDSHFPDIEKDFTESVPVALTPPPKTKAAGSASKEKKPFLKAYAGSPHKPPKLTYSEKRKAAVAAGGVAEEPLEPFSFFKRSPSRSPSKRKTPVTSPEHGYGIHSVDHNLATTNREQVNVPPLSPRLLRRVGMGRNFETRRDIPLFQPDTQQDEEYQQQDLEAAEEGGFETTEEEEGEGGAQEHKSVADSYFSSGGESPRSDRRIFNGHPMDASVDGDGDDAMLGADDATLTTNTNSVAHSGIVSSLQDISISPTHTPYVYGTRFAGTPTVVELDLEEMLHGTGTEESAGDAQDVPYQDFMYEMDSAEDTVESVESGSVHSSPPSPPSPMLGASEDAGPATPHTPTVYSFTFAPTSETVQVAESMPDSPDFLSMLAGRVEEQRAHCSHSAHAEEDSICSDDEVHNVEDDGSSVSELSANTGNMTSMTTNKAVESPRYVPLERRDGVSHAGARSAPAHSPVVDFSLESSYIGGTASDQAVEDLSVGASIPTAELDVTAERSVRSADILPDTTPRVAFEIHDEEVLPPLGLTVQSPPADQTMNLLGEVQAHYVEHLNQVLDGLSTKFLEDLPPSPSRTTSFVGASAATIPTPAPSSTMLTAAPVSPVPHAHFEDDETSDVDLLSHLSDTPEAAAEVEALTHAAHDDEAEVAANVLLIESLQHEIDDSFSPSKHRPPHEGHHVSRDDGDSHSAAGSAHVDPGSFPVESNDQLGVSPLTEEFLGSVASHPAEEAVDHAGAVTAPRADEGNNITPDAAADEALAAAAQESLPAPAHPILDHAHTVLPAGAIDSVVPLVSAAVTKDMIDGLAVAESEDSGSERFATPEPEVETSVASHLAAYNVKLVAELSDIPTVQEHTVHTDSLSEAAQTLPPSTLVTIAPSVEQELMTESSHQAVEEEAQDAEAVHASAVELSAEQPVNEMVVSGRLHGHTNVEETAETPEPETNLVLSRDTAIEQAESEPSSQDVAVNAQCTDTAEEETLQMEVRADAHEVALNTSTDSAHAADALTDDDLCFSRDHLHDGHHGSAPLGGSLSDSLEMDSVSGLLEPVATVLSVGVPSASQSACECSAAETAPLEHSIIGAEELPAERDETPERDLEVSNEHSGEHGTTGAEDLSHLSTPATPTRPEADAATQYPRLSLEALILTPNRRFTDYEDEQPSPLMPSTSQFVTLSPDRELDNSSMFIRNLPDSTATSDRSDGSDNGGEMVDEGGGFSSQPHGVSACDLGSLISDDAQDQSCTDSVEEPLRTAPRPHCQSVSPRSQAQTQPEVDAAAAAAAQEKALSLQNTVQRQAEELAEANRAKAALEARLDETRQLLQLLVAGRVAGPPASTDNQSSKDRPHSAEIDIDALESTLKYVTVETVPGELSDNGGSLSASGTGATNVSGTKMRKSLRRLLDKKREEKMRTGGHDARRHSNNSGEDDGAEEEAAVHSPSRNSTGRTRGITKAVDDDSSDSGFSADSSSRNLLSSGKSTPRSSRYTADAKSSHASRSSSTSSASHDSPHRHGGLPLPAQSVRKDTTGTLHARGDNSAGIADRRLSVDDLEMEVTRVHTRSEDFASRDRDTPPVVSLELGHIFSSQSSDPHQLDSLATGSHGWGSMTGDDMDQHIPHSPPPPPPPASVPVATSAVVRSVQQVLPESALVQPSSLESGSRKPSRDQLLLSLDSVPLNQHIQSPRHLTVVVSSSSSSAGSDGEIERDEAELLKALSNVSFPASPPVPITTFSPQNSASSLTGKANTFSPRQIGHKSPIMEGHIHTEVPQHFSADSYHSEGESSVDSHNPLLMATTPKIRGAGRRGVTSTQPSALPHPIPMPLGTLPSGSHPEESLTPNSLHSHFFHDDSVLLTEPALPSVVHSHGHHAHPLAHPHAHPHTDLLHKTDTPFQYNYDTYHALRPDLFLDSGPNSPFNPHSPFMHPADAALNLAAEQIEDDVYLGKMGSSLGVDLDVAAATKANTAANTNIFKRSALSKHDTSGSGVSHPPSAEKVSFRLPNEADLLYDDDEDLDYGVGVAQEYVVEEGADETEETEVIDEPEPEPEFVEIEVPVPAPRPPSPVVKRQKAPPAVRAVETSPPRIVAADKSNAPAADVQAPVAVVAPIAITAPASTNGRADVDHEAAPVAPAALTHTIEEAPTAVRPTLIVEPSDKLSSLFGYSLPLLVTARYMDNTALRGLAGRQELQRTTGTRDLLAWCVFQAYGTPEGAVVKGIK